MKNPLVNLMRRYSVLVVLLLTTLACNLLAGNLQEPTEPGQATAAQNQETEAPQGTAEPTEIQQPADTPTPTEVEFTFTLVRQFDGVFSGSADPLQPFSGDEPQPFPEGFLVLTDPTGEGVLEGDLEGKRCRIFVFSTTRMQKKACARATFESGNISCVEEGSAVFSECSNHVVTTASGALQLVGSYVMVTYLPDSQVSVFMVSDGEALVRPVMDEQSYEMGSETLLTAGNFYYTAPNPVLPSISGLPSRESLSFDRLPALLQQYDLSTWINRASSRSEEANVPFPDPELVFGPADLVIEIETFEPAQGLDDVDDTVPGTVPVRATVTNRGGSAADIFKLAVFGQSTDGNFLRPFQVPGQAEGFYPFTAEPLQPGGQVIFEGIVSFSRELQGEPAEIQSQVDSCSGEEFAPANCRIDEFDEENNISNVLELIIP
jgi:hypothetical protein